MKHLVTMLVFLSFISTGCKKEKQVETYDNPPLNNESYLPMQVGNYWKINDQNYTKILGTKTISDQLFYEVVSLIGGDAGSVQYLRINDDGDLIEMYPDGSSTVYTHAKFNAEEGGIFYTTGRGDLSDNMVKLVEKKDDIIKFEWDMVYHPNMKGHKSYRSYKKGLGFFEEINPYTEIKIGEDIYRF